MCKIVFTCITECDFCLNKCIVIVNIIETSSSDTNHLEVGDNLLVGVDRLETTLLEIRPRTTLLHSLHPSPLVHRHRLEPGEILHDRVRLVLDEQVGALAVLLHERLRDGVAGEHDRLWFRRAYNGIIIVIIIIYFFYSGIPTVPLLTVLYSITMINKYILKLKSKKKKYIYIILYYINNR